MSSSIHLSYCHAPKLLISKKLMMSDEGKNLKLSLLLAHKEEVHTLKPPRKNVCHLYKKGDNNSCNSRPFECRNYVT